MSLPSWFVLPKQWPLFWWKMLTRILEIEFPETRANLIEYPGNLSFRAD
jgi:hypothetical protein